jgi:hypothetical protein
MASFVWTGATSGDPTTTTNWIRQDGDTSANPGNGDSVIFDGRAVNGVTTDLASLSAVTLTSLIIKSSFNLAIGAVTNGVVTYFTIGATNVVIGELEGDGSEGSGSNLIAINLGSATNTTRVKRTASTGTDDGLAPVMLKGSATANKLVVEGGWVGVGTALLNETYTLQQCDVIGESANVELGGGGSLTTINQTAGRILFRNNLTTFDQQGGTAVTEGTGTITTANIGGTLVSNSSGTITTANVNNSGVLDLTGSTVARTITNAIVNGTGRIVLPLTDYDVMTFTNSIDLLRGARSQQIENWTNVTLTPSAP